MFGSVMDERAAIEMTYEDVAAVTRKNSGTKLGSLTVQTDEPVYAGLPCAISRTGSDSSRQDEANKVDYDAVVFCAPDLNIRPGDGISVQRFGLDNPSSTMILQFEVIGIPSVYSTHQEVKVRDGDLA